MANSKGLLFVLAIMAFVGVILGAPSFFSSLATSSVRTEPPKERLIWMEAVEYKGSTETAKLAPPSNLEKNPNALGPAFGFK